MWNDLKDLLQAKVQRAGIAKQIEATTVVEWFNQNRPTVVGEGLAPYVQAVFVRNRSLTLACASASARQELRAQEAAIVAQLQRRFGSDVERLRFTAG